MSVVQVGFPDVELVLLGLLEPVAPTVTSTPNPLTPPLIRVRRVGGSDDGLTDFPRVEVACYGPDRHASWALAERCRQLLLAASATHVAGVLIDKAVTDTPAQQIPEDSDDFDRVVATYRLALRRPFSEE